MLSIEQWNTRLLQASFTGVEFEAKDYDGPAQNVTMIVSKADSAKSAPTPPRIVNILQRADAARNSDSLTSRLKLALEDMDFSVQARKLSELDVTKDQIYVVMDSEERPLHEKSTLTESMKMATLFTVANSVLWITTLKVSTADPQYNFFAVEEYASNIHDRNEHLRFVMLNIEHGVEKLPPDVENKISKIIHATFFAPAAGAVYETHFVYKNGLIQIPRLKPSTKVSKRLHTDTDTQNQSCLFHQHEHTVKLHRGSLTNFENINNLCFMSDRSLQSSTRPAEIEIQVEAFGVNLVDALVASGRMKASTPTLGEYAGIVTDVGSHLQEHYRIGDRVCGWGKAALYPSRIRVGGLNVHHIPESLNFSMGASIPVAFITAYYALVDLANLRKDQSVMIRAATEDVGQAALQIALNMSVRVFATVGSASNRAFLTSAFQLPEEHIFSDTNDTFKRGIRQLTKGKGLDVILDASSGTLFEDSWACIADFGRFVQIKKPSVSPQAPMSMRRVDKNATLFNVDLITLVESRPEDVNRIMGQVMLMFKDGKLMPVEPLTTMSLTDIKKAFDIVQDVEEAGKIVLEADSNTVVDCVPDTLHLSSLQQSGTYVLFGDFGCLERDLCGYFASRGVREVAFLSFDNPKPKRRQALESLCHDLEIQIRFVSYGASDQNPIEGLISPNSYDWPSVEGILLGNMAAEVSRRA